MVDTAVGHLSFSLPFTDLPLAFFFILPFVPLNTCRQAVGGLGRVPPGWDQWYGLQVTGAVCAAVCTAVCGEALPLPLSG